MVSCTLTVDPVKAVIKEKSAELKYETITKYSFLDDKKKVKIYIDMEDIGSIPKENIHSQGVKNR